MTTILFSGHPWILFYTERTLRTLTIKSKLKNQVGASHHHPAILSGVESDENKIDRGSRNDESHALSSSESLNSESEVQDECGFVDALAVAISNVRISEPKRSRLCGPSGPIEQQCSSNLTANALCRAF